MAVRHHRVLPCPDFPRLKAHTHQGRSPIQNHETLEVRVARINATTSTFKRQLREIKRKYLSHEQATNLDDGQACGGSPCDVNTFQ